MLGCAVDIILTLITGGLWIPIRVVFYFLKKKRQGRQTPAAGKFRNFHNTQAQYVNIGIQNYEELPRLEAPAGYVYIIKDVSHSNDFKIGRTNHPKRRLNSFGVTLPIETIVVAVFMSNNAAELESSFHQRYRASRTQGEWFDLSKKQLNEIRSL